MRRTNRQVERRQACSSTAFTQAHLRTGWALYVGLGAHAARDDGRAEVVGDEYGGCGIAQRTSAGLTCVWSPDTTPDTTPHGESSWPSAGNGVLTATGAAVVMSLVGGDGTRGAGTVATSSGAAADEILPSICGLTSLRARLVEEEVPAHGAKEESVKAHGTKEWRE